MKRILECVPNFSEGRDRHIIDAIIDAIYSSQDEGIEGCIKVLHTDMGEAANRTVITFAGTPEMVVEAAFRAVKKAGELIDMRIHHGEHPRIGATDVLPLIPLSGVTMEECILRARDLARRIFEELDIPCYCYEHASFRPARRNLAVCRSGEYEGLKAKIENPDKRPDFSHPHWTPAAERCGAVNVGARNILIAVNFNLNTTSAELAHEIAVKVRESSGGPLKGCKAIGWYIKEYGCAQVSMNITDIDATPLHKAWEQVCASACEQGLKVTGTEIIGLVPERCIVQAGRYLAGNMKADTEEAVATAIEVMGLNVPELFDPERKTIERLLEDE